MERSAPRTDGDGGSPITMQVAGSAGTTRDRRAHFRREADRLAHEEARLLAETLDILATDEGASDHLARLLDRLALRCGARRAAVLSDQGERRVATVTRPGEPPAEAELLAAWLDAEAPRSRAERAAAVRAPVTLVSSPAGSWPDVPGDDPGVVVHRLVPVPGTGGITLGFAFDDPEHAANLPERLRPGLARSVAVALGLITAQLAEERELGRLRARESERTRFVSTVAHELRTPLTGLGGYLDLILDGKVEDEAVEGEFLERARQIVTAMSELVSDLLEVSRIDAGSLALAIRPLSLADAIQRVAEQLEPIALQRGTTLRLTPPPRLRTALGDRRRVEQVLTNLVANAIKFSPAGSAVEVSARVDAGVALLFVRDEGDGITVEDRDRIFERFQRLGSHQRISGTGLGLSIARELARAMDGDLTVASVPGSGSAFILALPGPGPIERSMLEGVVRRAVMAEEIALEERAVLRAIRAAGGKAAAGGMAAASGGLAGAGTHRVATDGVPPGDPPTEGS